LKELTGPELSGNHFKSLLWTSYPPTKKAHEVHTTINWIRKELRVVTDEQDLFQDFFIPSTNLPDKSMVLLKETRALLGAINDEWNKLNDLYSNQSQKEKKKDDKKTTSKLKASIRSLNIMWKGFQGWVKTIDLESVMEGLVDCLEKRAE
jgi:hypothetical protein